MLQSRAWHGGKRGSIAMFTLFVFFLDLLQVAGGLEQNLHVLQKSVDVLLHGVVAAGVEDVREGAPELGPRGLVGLHRGLGLGLELELELGLELGRGRDRDRGRDRGRGRGGGEPRTLTARLLARPPAFPHGEERDRGPPSCVLRRGGGLAAGPGEGRREKATGDPAGWLEQSGTEEVPRPAGAPTCRIEPSRASLRVCLVCVCVGLAVSGCVVCMGD